MAKKSAKKTAKKSTKKAAAKKSASKKSTSKSTKKTARTMAGARAATAQDGSPVALFFDKVEGDTALQARVAMQNTKILEVAKAEGFAFTYADMAEHLRARWCIICGPIEDYCCF